MRPHSRHEQEVVGYYTPDVAEHLALGGSHDVHHVVGVAPLPAHAQHLLKQTLAAGVGRELEVVAAFVACECKQHHPFAVVSEKRAHAVLAHVGCYGKSVDVVFSEERTCIHGRGVADVAAFGVGDDEVVRAVGLEVVYGFLESDHPLYSESLVEGQVGFVCHAIGCRGVDDGLVESEYRIFVVQQMLRYFFQIGVESHA